jgi:hypothetical protein
MKDGSYCVVFRSTLNAEFRHLLEGYLNRVPSDDGGDLYCAFCSAVEPMERFIKLRLTAQSDRGHVWSISLPISVVMAVIDQSEAQNPIGFQARVDQIAD